MRSALLVSLALAAACSAPESDGWLVDVDVDAAAADDAIRTRQARIAVPILRDADGPRSFDLTADSISLTLFDDLVVDATLDQLTHTHRGISWRGHVDGWPEYEVVLSRSGDRVAGIVRTPESLVRIRPVDAETVALDELHVSRSGGDLEPLAPVWLPAPDAAGDPVHDADEAIIDVLIAYTTPVGTDEGGAEGMEAVAVTLINQANEGWADSGISAELRLAGVVEADWDESGFDWSPTLTDLADPEDGVLDDVPEARDDTGADAVVLLVQGDGGACGLAYLMPSATPAFAPAAYGLVDHRCAGSNLSFAHELGHTLGSQHDRDSARATPANPFAYGHKDSDAGFRTVMSYACDDGPCPRINHWSNPDVSIEDAPTGIATTSTDSAHNVASIALTAGVVADFREAVDPGPEAKAAEILLPEDGTRLGGTSLTLAWAEAGADEYIVAVGSTAGASDVAKVSAGTSAGWTIGGLPEDGSTLYVTLWSDFDGEWLTDTATYKAKAPPNPAARLTSPTAGTQLASGAHTFTWSDVGADAYVLTIGSTRFGSDQGAFATEDTSVTVSGLPTDGRALWLTLYTESGAGWLAESIEVQAASATESGATEPASLVYPEPGATLTGRTITFVWTDVEASAYAVTLTGETGELIHAEVTSTSHTVTLPTSTAAGTLQVRLATRVGSHWIAETVEYTLE